MGSRRRCGAASAALAGATKVIVTLGDEPLLTPAVIARFLVGAGRHARDVSTGGPGIPVVLGPEQLTAIARADAAIKARGAARAGPHDRMRASCARAATSTPLKTWRRSAVKLEQSFEVAAPLERVWEALIDVEQVAPCLPGASVTGRNEDGSYSGSLTIKIGPTTAAYAGKLEMEQIDEASHSATMQAQGTDKRGQGGAKATISSSCGAVEDGGTHVEVITDYHITGRLARFGRGGMIEDISERLLREFAQSLQASLTGARAEAPAADSPRAAERGAGSRRRGGQRRRRREQEAPAASEPGRPAEPRPVEPLDAVPLVASVRPSAMPARTRCRWSRSSSGSCSRS